jgi:uncharacterized repeat protein (TIGR04138 family)
LRALPLDSNCPECGEAISETLRNTPALRVPELRHAIMDLHRDVLRARCEPVARDAGCAVDAVMLVKDVLGEALRVLDSPLAQGKQHITAAEICAACSTYCAWYFNDRPEAIDLLSEWGMRCSEDLGCIIFAMVRAGWIRTRPEDSPSDFDNLFTLDTLFPPDFK